jgi:CRISPR/Cas system-associated protein Cas10 (large subunit of type III CRISPR-Cas system)
LSFKGIFKSINHSDSWREEKRCEVCGDRAAIACVDEQDFGRLKYLCADHLGYRPVEEEAEDGEAVVEALREELRPIEVPHSERPQFGGE